MDGRITWLGMVIRMIIAFGSKEASELLVKDAACFAMRDQLIAEYGDEAKFLDAVEWALAEVESEESLLCSMKNDQGDDESGVTDESIKEQQDIASSSRRYCADLMEKKRAACW